MDFTLVQCKSLNLLLRCDHQVSFINFLPRFELHLNDPCSLFAFWPNNNLGIPRRFLCLQVSDRVHKPWYYHSDIYNDMERPIWPVWPNLGVNEMSTKSGHGLSPLIYSIPFMSKINHMSKQVSHDWKESMWPHNAWLLLKTCCWQSTC